MSVRSYLSIYLSIYLSVHLIFLLSPPLSLSIYIYITWLCQWRFMHKHLNAHKFRYTYKQKKNFFPKQSKQIINQINLLFLKTFHFVIKPAIQGHIHYYAAHTHTHTHTHTHIYIYIYIYIIQALSSILNTNNTPKFGQPLTHQVNKR